MSHGTLQPPFFVSLATMASWAILFIMGHVRDMWRARYGSTKKGYAPVRQNYEDFYTRRMYYRIHDCWNRPICSAPDAHIQVMERTPVSGQKALTLTGRIKKCLNLGSYNYLGFAASDEYCTPRVLDTMGSLGWAMCSSRADAGTTPVHLELERLVADFVGKEAALTFGMGFATNSVILPALVGKGCLLISDSLNHASIVTGARGSGAKVKVFAHNDVEHLESVLRRAIAEGQPRIHRPWKKILIVVEGIYSMEGEMANLAGIVALKKKYRAYLYLDEAHSIGALGRAGRGACEAQGVEPKDIDVMMGTFTKSFGSCGGYIAADRELIQHLKHWAPGHLYATSLAPPAAQQIMSAMRLLRGEDGSDRGARKLAQLRANSDYFRARLLDMGCNVLGDWGSPVMPLMIFNPGKIAALSRLCWERGVALVVVGFPATPLQTARARICISAAHTRKDLDNALKVLDEVTDVTLTKYFPRGHLVNGVKLNGLVH
ncbi:hypothetical protein CVIRNUC_005327 [Coccomyxa viridis]|uniref:serine C-palmitoyltransferase n=1 Tax=Coccomyxa viridis TaxID=1274662 RepID=A0AAV1I872_9CHLO|nr:hypothetical protein CVIRNUC_005327 [Coccomyxa viridis]